MRWLLCVGLLVGCVDSNAVVCTDGKVCPEETTCNVALGLCVTPQQAAACGGVADGLVCDVTSADEVCFQGVCLPSLCGDGIIAPNEVCDDSNAMGGDGCSARCDSTETCGNGAVDLSLGEDCDDANFVEHDGCSSICKVETPTWLHRPLALPARFRAGAAYDSKADRIIVLGGHGNRLLPQGVLGIELDDAWEWDGRWREASFQPPPPADYSFGLTYDTKHERTLRYNGSPNSTEAELWSFDGSKWTRIWRLTTATPGPSVANAAIAYDPINDQLVVHGGYKYEQQNGVIETSDTWFYSEATKTWTQQVNTAGGINLTRVDAAMAFDPLRGRIVMYGGYGTNTLRNDLWELDNRTWSSGSMTNGPATGRKGAALAWNTSCQCLVLFGGAIGTSGTQVTSETFTRTGTTWANLTATSNPPPARSHPALASDGHGRNILVGGSQYIDTNSSDTTAYFEDQWIFDGSTWHEERGFRFSTTAFDTARRRVVFYGGDDIASPGESDPNTYELGEDGLRVRATGAPDAPTGAAIAYDEERHETVLLGGRSVADVLNTSTYSWDGTSWTTRAALPTALQQIFPVVQYDNVRKEVVAFGGCDPGVACNNETWTWNGSTWTKKTPATSPSGRWFAASGFDRVNGRLVVFGGADASATAFLAETWTWDGTTWTKIATPNVPSIVRPLMAWDPARRRLVMITGTYFDAWEWTGSDWSFLGNLGLHFSPSGAYAFSGLDGAGITYTGGQWAGASDTWELVWTSDHPDDVCRLGEEHDGDGLASCADQDCWGVCTPSCLPGDTCSATTPRCGDGTCSTAESCRSCPTDCTSCKNVCGDGQCDTGETCPGDCS